MNDGTIFSSVQDRDKLSHLVLNSIKEAVVQGRLKPGDKLPGLADMAEEMGVGISSVREAIKMLEALEVLESKQGKGVYVQWTESGGHQPALITVDSDSAVDGTSGTVSGNV